VSAQASEESDLDRESDDFRDLLRRVGEGSEEAAWELVERYGGAIHRAVRRALHSKLRPKFDSLDFVQLVWSSFFRGRDNLARFERPGELAAFLATMARNKVGMEARRRLMTDKYNLNRERPLDASGPAGAAREIAGSQPTPADVAIARELWDSMLRDQPEHYRRIIELRLQGRTHQEIADTLHLAQSTVRRFLKRLFRERFE